MAKIPKYQYKHKRKLVPNEDKARMPSKPKQSIEPNEIEEGINEYERAVDKSD